MKAMSDELSGIWMIDQTLALAAALLSGTAIEVIVENDYDEILDRLELCTQYISDNLDGINIRNISISTLRLLGNIPDAYIAPNAAIFDCAAPMGQTIQRSRQEIERRTGSSISPRLLAHATYLLRQKHINTVDFFKWLQRCCGNSIVGIESISNELHDNVVTATLNRYLATARDPSQPTRFRVSAVDDVYRYVSQRVERVGAAHWWANICLAFRNSIFRWPLMISESLYTYSRSNADEQGRTMCGISLPLGLSLSDDGKGKVWMRHFAPIGSKERNKQYVRAEGDKLAHIFESKLCWDNEWENAFRIGFKAAKELWRSQNGRLRFADEQKTAAIMNSSLVVDLGATCRVVDELFSSLEAGAFPLAGRSAEAYWVQAALSLMLPGAPDPRGVATGRIESAGGTFEIKPVRGIRNKLIFANNMGFSRIILPRPSATISEESNVEAIGSSPSVEGDALSDDVSKFIADLDSEKSAEINFCANARNAADAMQTSGWRRTNFLRLAETQRTFHFHLHRLYLRHQVQVSKIATPRERKEYEKDPWKESETSYMETLDRSLLSEGRAIKYVRKGIFRGNPESDIGKWLAWKDQQIRSGEVGGYRKPGLGILSLRTHAEDNGMRLWSAIADSVSASGSWWDKFQWSALRQASSLLADLLSNQRCELSISSSPAPDILVIFDDGDQTQLKRNRVFQDDFRGNWVDLLNPRKDDPSAVDPLNQYLIAKGPGPLGNTKIIVIHGKPRESIEPFDIRLDLDSTQSGLLEQLSIFRYGFSKQAAFSMGNFPRSASEKLDWGSFNEVLSSLIRLDLVRQSRDRLYLTERTKSYLQIRPTQTNPNAHFHAAKALNPILDPSVQYVASNHDRQLEPEPILEATWHLNKAAELATNRGSFLRSKINETRGRLVFLSPYPDWDTVKQLRKHTQTAFDAILLAKDLLKKEADISKLPPHSSRVAAYFATVGIFANGHATHLPEGFAEKYSDELKSMLDEAVDHIKASSKFDARRQRRKLFSDYIFAMRNLGVENSSNKISGTLSYIDKTIKEILRSDIQSNSLLAEDFPISKEFWSQSWSDLHAPITKRSTAAYCASITSMDVSDEGSRSSSPSCKSWMSYFSLTSHHEFSAGQIVRPLRAWQSQFGHSRATASLFGRHVMDFASFKKAKPKNSGDVSSWGRTIQSASENLWGFVGGPELDNRLHGTPVDIALDIIRVTSLSESIPAYDFIRRRGCEWLKTLPKKSPRQVSSSWSEFVSAVTGSEAGWVALLSSFRKSDDDAIQVIKSWLDTLTWDQGLRLSSVDPEYLTRNTNLDISRQFLSSRTDSIFNGYKLIYGNSRHYDDDNFNYRLRKVLYDIDGGRSGWFFVLANTTPRTSDIGPITLMINDLGDRETFLKMSSEPKLRRIFEKVEKNLITWRQLMTKSSHKEAFELLEAS